MQQQRLEYYDKSKPSENQSNTQRRGGKERKPYVQAILFVVPFDERRDQYHNGMSRVKLKPPKIFKAEFYITQTRNQKDMKALYVAPQTNIDPLRQLFFPAGSFAGSSNNKQHLQYSGWHAAARYSFMIAKQTAMLHNNNVRKRICEERQSSANISLQKMCPRRLIP